MDINLLLSPQEPAPKGPPPAPETTMKKSRKLRSSKVVDSSNSNSSSNNKGKSNGKANSSSGNSNSNSNSNVNSNGNGSNNNNSNSSNSNGDANTNTNSNSSSDFSNVAHTTIPPPPFSHSVVIQAQHVMRSPPLISPASALRVHAAVSTPPADGNRAMRQPSTPRMDTLADLASMQHHQQTTRANAGGLRSAEIRESQSSSTSVLPQLHAITKSQASTRGSMELPVTEPRTQSPSPRHYSATSLTETELQTVAHLVTHLAANPFAYESHVQLVKLLHQGLVSYVDPHSSSKTPTDPHKYDLLQDLRNAREAMNATFALGEDLWVDWIEDQQLLAITLDDRITVIESCQKALDEEPGSTRLWLRYAEWMLSMFRLANTEDERALAIGRPAAEEIRWSEEDIALAQSVCSWEQVLEVWRQGVEDTKWRMNDSHLLWDRYTELIMQDLGRSPSTETIKAVKSHFSERLRTPHAKWDATFQSFSTFVSGYDNLTYEETMVAAIRQGSEAKTKYALREMLELSLQRATERGDLEAEWKAFNEYIDWEMSQSRKKLASSFELVTALHQRATLRFPTDTALWEGFVIFLNDEFISFGRDISALPVLNRATSHCPWSGTLWSQYLLVAERERQSFPKMHNIKHKATSTGLLDAGDMPEVLKVYTAWCGFLRRRAFHDDSTDEDMDVAEVGIRSAIEDMETLGREKYGKNYQGDPEYRLQRTYIEYLSQCFNWQGARNAWKSLVATHGDSYDFWLRYYLWEMTAWVQLAYGESGLNGSSPTKPSQATHVLQQALQRPKLDWPEKILETFQHHCEQHEDVEGLQAAVILIWKARKLVAVRREKEAVHALEVAPKLPLQEGFQENREHSGSGFNIGKRKRGDEPDGSEAGILKKYRLEVSDGARSTPDEVISFTPKRDRENSTVIVRNLPYETTETRVRQFFRDCGTINSLKLLPENDNESATATIEFDSKEDVLTAQTKDMKTFDGRTIEVQVGTGSTLFVTNFPPTTDEREILEMFAKFGEVVDVRFPSLKKNTHRRFCYVQLKTSHQARAATKLDGKDFGAKHKLTVKISDPERKQARTGALYEGRELHLAQLDWSATEDEVQQTFVNYGKVERVRIPRDVEGKSKGFGFVVFSSKEEAAAALEMNLKMFKTRILHVSLSTVNPAKRQATTIVATSSRSSNSPSPELARADGVIDDATSSITSANNEHKPSTSDIQSRTVALLNVPDTVNDSRIRALAEPYGALVKVVLRPDHQGAILEYRDIPSAGKATLGLDGHELVPGRKLGIGTVQEMLHQKAEVKSDHIDTGGSKKSVPGSNALQSAGPIRRPIQPNARRGGGKGGLGVKRRGLGLGVSANVEGGQNKPTADEKVDGSDERPKSNADFKAMFLNE